MISSRKSTTKPNLNFLFIQGKFFKRRTLRYLKLSKIDQWLNGQTIVIFWSLFKWRLASKNDA